jgi:hypothetical protein
MRRVRVVVVVEVRGGGHRPRVDELDHRQHGDGHGRDGEEHRAAADHRPALRRVEHDQPGIDELGEGQVDDRLVGR